MAIVVKTLAPSDIALVLNAAAGVFDEAPRETLTAEFLADPRHHLVGAIEGEQLVGFASAVHYIHPDKPAGLWINEVGVAFGHRGCGVGTQILQRILSHAREVGCTHAWVLTERSNRAAMRLYAQAGGVEAPSPSVMFEFPL